MTHEAEDILARTIYGEARGEGVLGMECVASVILNRVNSGVKWWGTDVISVCLKPWQFSCWNANDPNRAKLLAVTHETPTFCKALDVARKALTSYLPDSTNGADSYFARSLPTPPKWSIGLTPVATVKNHVFYKTVKWRE